ncbi:DUF4238 domain-containing protein [Aristaeella hokkaidonensis]|uniref:DUF4238 domain-containing protein n=1 Tax=Aristaeella hokkaidonensis TaxID=3046382 RepID=A0AC61MV95_9FIRM|nr:DUF4238 domain-containing protein [Aristaeella hokkaidonensis]QUC66107.1 DUF4238 domain-containing protein [Aristaeella hokkaidonensis]SNT94890.1 Protein of unknown function [Aristaeella hokkaidonensis]
MDISSHIQMPRCVLKRFEDSNHRLFYFDVQKGFIGTNGHAKTINTQVGYYSQSTEEFLKNNIEDPLSQLLLKLDKIDFNSDISILPTLDVSILYHYIYSLISRSPSLLNMFDSNSLNSLNDSKQFQHDFIATKGFIHAKEKHLLRDFNINYMINKSPKSFILPTLGMYSFIMKRKLTLIAPLSPQLAVAFIRDRRNPNTRNIYDITDEKIIYSFNSYAFKYQCNEKNGYIVSPNKEALNEQINNKE